MDLLGGSGDTALALHPASVCKTQSLEKSLVFSICLGDYSVFMSVANNWAKGNRRSVSRPMLSPGQGFGRQYEAGTGSKTEAEGLWLLCVLQSHTLAIKHNIEATQVSLMSPELTYQSVWKKVWRETHQEPFIPQHPSVGPNSPAETAREDWPWASPTWSSQGLEQPILEQASQTITRHCEMPLTPQEDPDSVWMIGECLIRQSRAKLKTLWLQKASGS